MKIDIETLKDTFKISYDTFKDSRDEALKVLDLYHNRQYTDTQLLTLANRGQPAETFNVIKMFARMLLGYYSTVVNTVKVNPQQTDGILTAAILNDLVSYVFESNSFNSEGDKIKLDCILTGLMASYVDVQKSGEFDEFGRPKYDIKIHHVPSIELAIDPMSMLDDYSDARFIHRFKWVAKEAAENLFGAKLVSELDSYHNHLNIDEAEFTKYFNDEFRGYYKVFDNYLIVQTVIKDDNDKTWSIYWSGDTILSKKEITYKEVKNPYRLHKLHSSNKAEYYGMFREIVETQHAINQALIKIQLMVNTQKAFIEDGAVENLATFTDQFNRVNAVIPVKSLAGIRIENLTREVLDQYTVIDRALDRIQRILSINDSFLGMAYASDSGTKVKLQQNASVVALRYITSKVEQFYRLLGWDIMNLIKQYFTAHDVIRIADNYEGMKWVEINKPIQLPTGRVLPNGMPEMQYALEEVIDPETNKPMVDLNGNIIMAPIPYRETEIAFTKADVTVESVAYNDEDERNRLMLEQVLNGPMGNMLSQVNPAGYFRIANLAVKNIKNKYTLEISSILEETAQMLSGGNPAAQAMMQGQVAGQMTPTKAVNNSGGY
jgi:hypothetical protein